MTQAGLQSVVTTNVKVLMAVKRIEAQKDLAAKLGWGESKLTKSLRGDRKWSLEDLPELAEAFGVQPSDLIGDITHLVNVAAPARTGTEGGVSRGVSGRCPRTNPRVVIPFPQIRGTRRGYRSRRTLAAIKRGVRPAAAMNTGHPYAAPVA